MFKSTAIFSHLKMASLAIDVHTHIYLPRYMDILRSRKIVPRILPGVDEVGDERYVILPGEDIDSSTSKGRPVGSEFWDPARKLAFMDTHGIEISVLSLANPWLDFAAPEEAAALAVELNNDMHNLCTSASSAGRFYGFGILPTSDPAACAGELRRLMALDRMRGVILSARGLGSGLDDRALDEVWATAEELDATIFIHPHYGIGQVLPHKLGLLTNSKSRLFCVEDQASTSVINATINPHLAASSCLFA